jgi:hypothetical protein
METSGDQARAIGLPGNREKYRESHERRIQPLAASRAPAALFPRILCQLFANNGELLGKIREFEGMELGGFPQLRGKWQKG